MTGSPLAGYFKPSSGRKVKPGLVQMGLLFPVAICSFRVLPGTLRLFKELSKSEVASLCVQEHVCVHLMITPQELSTSLTGLELTRRVRLSG